MRVESSVVRVESLKVKSYRDLIAWQKSMDLLVNVYKQTGNFPKEEIYGITNQMRRASVSVPSNIAEGSSRRSTKEFIRAINIANGSLAELETQVIASRLLGYLMPNEENDLLKQTDEISRILQGLYNSLKSKTTRLSTLDSNN